MTINPQRMVAMLMGVSMDGGYTQRPGRQVTYTAEDKEATAKDYITPVCPT